MSYSDKLRELKELEEKKSELMSNIQDIMSSLDEESSAGPKSENESEKVKVVGGEKEQPKRWIGRYPPGTKVSSGNGYFITHSDGSFDGPYTGD